MITLYTCKTCLEKYAYKQYSINCCLPKWLALKELYEPTVAQAKKSYYERKSEVIKAKNKAYYEANKEKVNKRTLALYFKNKNS